MFCALLVNTTWQTMPSFAINVLPELLHIRTKYLIPRFPPNLHCLPPPPCPLSQHKSPHTSQPSNELVYVACENLCRQCHRCNHAPSPFPCQSQSHHCVKPTLPHCWTIEHRWCLCLHCDPIPHNCTEYTVGSSRTDRATTKKTRRLLPRHLFLSPSLPQSRLLTCA